MEWMYFLLCCMCCTLVKGNVNIATLVPSDYDVTQEPSPTDGSPMNVGVSWHIKGVFAVNFHEMTVIVAMYFRMSWAEPRLRPPAGTFKKSSVVPLHSSILQKVWLPDLYIHEAADISSFSMIQKVQGVFLEENYTIVFSSLLQTKLACPMYFTKFPFDVQVCPMTVSSYYFGEDKIKLDWMNLGVTADNEVNHQLPNYNFRIQASEITSKIWCENCTFAPSSIGKSQLVFERKYAGHLFTIYLPSTLVVSLAWVSFFWPPDAIPGRTVLIITSLLTMISMYSAVGQRSPETSYLKAVDVWLVVCILHVVLALFQYAVIITIRRKEDERKVPQIFPVNTLTINRLPPMGMGSPTLDDSEGGEGGTGGRRLIVDTSAALASGSSSRNSSAYKPGVVMPPQHLRIQEQRVEKLGQIGLPFLFLMFNLIYWPSYVS